MKKLLTAKLPFLLLVLCANTLTMAEYKRTTAKIDAAKIANLTNDFFDLVPHLAHYKATNHIPIQRPKPHAEFLEIICKKAYKNQLSTTSVSDLFHEVITLSKAIQHRYQADFLLGKRLTKALPFKETWDKGVSICFQIIDSITDYTKRHGQLTPSDLEPLFNTQTRYLSSHEKHKLSMLLIESSKLTSAP